MESIGRFVLGDQPHLFPLMFLSDPVPKT